MPDMPDVERLINLTPRVIRIYHQNTPNVISGFGHRPFLMLPPSGHVVRLSEEPVDTFGRALAPTVEDPEVLGMVPIGDVPYRKVEGGWPDRPRGAKFVVDLTVGLVSRRRDLLVPWLEVLNEDGTVVGYRGFARVFPRT